MSYVPGRTNIKETKMTDKLKLGEYQKPNKDRTKASIDNYVKGMREKKGGKALSPRNVRKIKLKNGGPTGKYPSKGMNKLASKNPKVAKKIMGYKKGGKA